MSGSYFLAVEAAGSLRSGRDVEISWVPTYCTLGPAPFLSVGNYTAFVSVWVLPKPNTEDSDASHLLGSFRIDLVRSREGGPGPASQGRVCFLA